MHNIKAFSTLLKVHIVRIWYFPSHFCKILTKRGSQWERERVNSSLETHTIIPWNSSSSLGVSSLSLSLIQKTISITSFIATLLYLHVLLWPSYILGGFWRERHVVTPVIAPRVTFHLWRITVQARTWGFSCQMFVVLQNLVMFQWERKVHGIYTGDFNYFVYHCIEFNSRFGLIVNNKHEE